MDPFNHTSRYLRRAIVDDTDPNIVWDGDWSVTTEVLGGIYSKEGPFIGNTQSVTTTRGSMTYFFRGTEVRVHGARVDSWGRSIDASSPGTGPSWSCIVDGVAYPPYTAAGSAAASSINLNPVDRYPLCNVTNLREGSHNLTVTATASSQRLFYIDYITYLPLRADWDSLHPTVLFECNQQGIYYYDDSRRWGYWSHDAGSSMYARMGGSKGGRAVVRFWGTRATWVGPHLNPDGKKKKSGKAKWSLTYGEETEFEIPWLPRDAPSLSAGSSFRALGNQVYFSTPQLATRGPHSLVVTHEGGDAPLALEYLVIEDGELVKGSGGAFFAEVPYRPDEFLDGPVGVAVGFAVLFALCLFLGFVRLRVAGKLWRLLKSKPNSIISPSSTTTDRRAVSASMPTRTTIPPSIPAKPTMAQVRQPKSGSGSEWQGLPGLASTPQRSPPPRSAPARTAVKSPMDGSNHPNHRSDGSQHYPFGSMDGSEAPGYRFSSMDGSDAPPVHLVSSSR